MKKHRRWWITGIAVLGGSWIVAEIVLANAGLTTRDRLVRKLSERFRGQVKLGALDLATIPRPRAVGDRFEIERNGQPFLAIERFTAASGLFHLLWLPPHVQHVRLDGLRIKLPPRSHGPKKPQQAGGNRTVRFVMDEIAADGTVIETTPRESWKDPLRFDVRRLTLYSAGVDRPMTFRAMLHNPKPPGDVNSDGSFGPWSNGDPGDTPVSGNYTFRNANLAVFRGISGILSSEGKYHGTLDHIEVDGHTDTPAFALKERGQTMPLRANFHSIVDGTDGDTLLQPVDATLGRTRILCRGGVEGTPGIKGKAVRLAVEIHRGHLDDLLRLAVDGDPPLIGNINLETKMEIPQGDREVVDKLGLDGHFAVDDARFTDNDFEQKLNGLSKRAQGRPKEAKRPGSVLSDFAGRFRLRDGLMTFDELTFAMPGAFLRLKGAFELRNQRLDFEGTVALDAKVSQMTTGVKSLLLKPVDPFFKKEGHGALIPIRIGGTSRHPDFGLRLRRVKD